MVLKTGLPGWESNALITRPLLVVDMGQNMGYGKLFMVDMGQNVLDKFIGGLFYMEG